MREALRLILCGVTALWLAGCQAWAVKPLSAESPEGQRVARALGEWPRVAKGAPGIKRQFFATFHAAGRRTTASGILEYYGPRDFRITAVTEMGMILFDGRLNWAGTTVLRHMPGLDPLIIETLLHDLSLAFDVPATASGLSAGNDQVLLRQDGGDGRQHVWTFDAATGRLRRTDVAFGIFDTLHADFLAYDIRGWPREISVKRPARWYDLTLSFTDSVAANERP